MIVCRSAAEIERLRAANQFVAGVLAELEAAVAPGVTTADLDRLAERIVRAGGAEPAFKGYRGYPATLCASINDEVVHGIPSATRALRAGDIISLDVGVKMDGYFGDSAVTVAVGEIPERTAALLQVTSEALDRAISQVRVGGRLSDIGHAVQEWVEMHGFSVVREFVGHGIGERLHEEPQIPNYGQPGRGPKLVEGMVLAKKAGVDPELMFQVLDASAAKAGLISFKAPYVFKRDFTAAFPLKWMHKDIGLMLESALELNVPLPSTSLVHELFGASIARGHGDEDICAAITLLEDWAGVEVKGGAAPAAKKPAARKKSAKAKK